MDSFAIVLKNEKLGSYKRIGQLVSAINFIFFLFYAFYAKQGPGRLLWIFLSVFILVFCYIELIIKKKDTGNKINFSVTYCYLILLWFTVSIWFVFIHILLLLLDMIARRSLQVDVDTNGIGYPSFPKKNIQWDELSNMVLKDGLLTIDFKNNKLIQVEIDSLNQPDEKAFNRYCEQQLNNR